MFVAEEKTIEIGGNNYLIKEVPALYCLGVLTRLRNMGDSANPEFIKEVVFKSITCNNIQPTEDWFNKHFSRNYEELFQLFEVIIDFNFGGEEEAEENPKAVKKRATKGG